MRAPVLLVLGVASIGGVLSSCEQRPRGVKTDPAVQATTLRSWDAQVVDSSARMLAEGRQIFRHDTFGSEAFWGGELELHRAILSAERGGTGDGLTPRQALQLGLKADVARAPRLLVEAIRVGAVSFDDPDTTLALLRADAVVGIEGVFDEDQRLVSVGITCALCHSTVDDVLAQGIGRRLDGWPNRDLDVGAIVAKAPNLEPLAELLDADVATVRQVLLSWGPGRYDAEVNQDGKAFRPDGKTGATLLPAAFGLAGQNLHTYTGRGSVPYWNAYVATTQMFGQGRFFDPRLADAEQFPLAARNGTWDIESDVDRITSKLGPLHYYQLSIPAPRPPRGSYDEEAAARGEALFSGKAACATCHVPPLFTEPGWAMHTGAEIGIDDFQSSRGPDLRYRTTPLRGLFARSKGGFYHDGRFATLRAVIEHYEPVLEIDLSEAEEHDLEQYLRSL